MRRHETNGFRFMMDRGVAAQIRRDEGPIRSLWHGFLLLTTTPQAITSFENSRDEFSSDFDDDNGTSRLDVLWQNDTAEMARSPK